MVVMKPFSIPKLSSRTLARGTTELVVQEALEMMSWLAGSYLSSLTPITMVTSSSVAGAEMITFLAPPLRCRAASSRLVKRPVDSITTSTPRSPQGSCAGSFCALASTRVPPTVIASSSKLTSSSSRPKVESYLSRWARVLLSVRSLTATISRSRPLAARKKLRPMRPKPLMPTRTVMLPPIVGRTGSFFPTGSGRRHHDEPAQAREHGALGARRVEQGAELGQGGVRVGQAQGGDGRQVGGQARPADPLDRQVVGVGQPHRLAADLPADAAVLPGQVGALGAHGEQGTADRLPALDDHPVLLVAADAGPGRQAEAVKDGGQVAGGALLGGADLQVGLAGRGRHRAAAEEGAAGEAGGRVPAPDQRAADAVAEPTGGVQDAGVGQDLLHPLDQDHLVAGAGGQRARLADAEVGADAVAGVQQPERQPRHPAGAAGEHQREAGGPPGE